MTSEARNIPATAAAWAAGGVREPARALVEEHQTAGAIPERLAGEWAALVADAAEPNAFAEPWFVAAGLRHLAAGDDVRLLAVRDRGGRLSGVLPLCVRPTYGRLSVRHVENWRHHHDFLGAPLVRAGEEAAFWAAVIDHLDRAPWAAGFLHVTWLAEDGPVRRGLAAAAQAKGRAAPIVHRSVRAMLASALSPQSYYEITVRKKKRKELARLQNRLAEQGEVSARRLADDEPLAPWCDDFLALERAGWKGEAGSALACLPATEAFFRDALAGARVAGRLEMLRLELDGKPIAMLVNFLTPPGSYSFKIAYDEAYARFSPGVLIQLDNLAILGRDEIAWMDSCAAENHNMIDHLWGERRSIVRVSVPLSGWRRGAIYRGCRALETTAAAARRLAQRAAA